MTTWTPKNFRNDQRIWLLNDYCAVVTPDVTIDLTKFDPDYFFPNGFIPSGIAVAALDDSGSTHGPYLPGGTGRAAAGLTYKPIFVYGLDGTLRPTAAVPLLTSGFVNDWALPFRVTANAAHGGYLDASAARGIIRVSDEDS